ncbi:ABC transporter [Puteibacter caeruleilacunae]|nr:ABC transporter [Puteibacter caeruleilacunae]
MRQIIKIAKAELSVLFFSPIAWLVIVIFAFQSYLSFGDTLENMLKDQEVRGILSNVTVDLFTDWGAIYQEMQKYLYLYIPLITMGLMSREYSSGSIKLLHSSPVSSLQIVAGKYLSMMIYSFIMIAVIIPPAIFAVYSIPDVDIVFILSGMLGLYLLLCAYSSIGLFMSSLTSYQVVAAVSTLAMLAVLNKVGELGQDTYFLRDITYWLALNGRAEQFISGLICSEDCLYFLLVVLLFLAFTVLQLSHAKMKGAVLTKIGRYVGVVGIVIVLGYISSRPMLVKYYDGTRTKANTLTENSQEIIEKLDGGLKITTYVNMADDNYWIGIPRFINRDLENFAQYIRFKPEIETEYVYYYDEPYRNASYGKPGVSSAEERARQTCDIFDMNFDNLLTPEEICEQIDLKAEDNSFVRLVERENGQKTFLRMFDDMSKHPGEREISAAFKRLVMKLPKVAFLQGNGERNINKVGDRDYRDFTISKTSRSALVNQGFDVLKMSPDTLTEIPADIKIVVIADLTSPLSDKGFGVVKKYVDRGGNLVIAVEPNHREYFKPLLDLFGVSILPGIMVHPTENFATSLTQAKVTTLAFDLSYVFGTALMRGVVTMPNAAGLDFELDNEYEVIPIAATRKEGSWNEMETTNFIEDTVSINKKIGEQERIIPLALALEREVSKRKQHVVILGDADCMSNGEINKKRKKLRASNFFFTMGIFEWLSDGEMPVDVRRDSAPDDHFTIELSDLDFWRILLLWCLPSMLAALGIFIRIRRQRR